VQARDFHRERVVARRHARSALQHDAVRRCRADERAERFAQFVRGFEAAFRCQVVFEEVIERAGDMPADGIDRLVLAAIAVGGAGIDQQMVARADAALDRLRVDGHLQRGAGLERALRLCRYGAVERVARGFPRLQAAVEQRDGIVTEPAQQPPQTRGVHAALRIVCNNLLPLVQAEARELRDERGAFGQRMAPVRARLDAGQIAVQMEIVGAGNMSLRVGLFARLGCGEIEAAIEDEDAAGRGGQPFGEIRSRDERGVVGVRHDGS
jgi:hypothetical protein